MNSAIFKGTGVAIVTPFHPDRSIDWEGLDRMIEHVIEGGVDYIVSLGSTGEAITCDAEECRQILDHTIAKINGRLPLVAGPFGYNSTKTLVDKIKSYDFSGIDAILSSSPSYIKPTQEGIYQHFMAMEKVCPVPIILYNVPGRTSSNMSAKTVVRLAKASTKFVGIKDASCDLSQALQIVKNKPEHFLLLSGDDEYALPLIACGGEGVISVISNAYPTIFSDMIRCAMGGDLEGARERHFQLLDFHQHLYVEGNPVGVKGLLEILGLINRTVRLPLVELSDDVKAKLAKMAERYQGVPA